MEYFGIFAVWSFRSRPQLEFPPVKGRVASVEEPGGNTCVLCQNCINNLEGKRKSGTISLFIRILIPSAVTVHLCKIFTSGVFFVFMFHPLGLWEDFYAATVVSFNNIFTLWNYHRCLRLDTRTGIYLNFFLSFLYHHICPGFDFEFNSFTWMYFFLTR